MHRGGRVGGRGGGGGVEVVHGRVGNEIEKKGKRKGGESEDSVGESLNLDRFRPGDREWWWSVSRKREKERVRGARLKNWGAGSGG